MKKNGLRVIVVVVLLFTICSAYAHERVRYVITKMINEDGVVFKQTHNNVRYFRFDGDFLDEYYSREGNSDSRYKYHHQEDGNYIYYGWCKEVDLSDLYSLTTKYVWKYSKRFIMMVSPDRKYFNYKFGNTTWVYEQRDVDTIGPMYK